MLTLILLQLGLALAERPTPPRTGNVEMGGAYSYYTSSSNYDLNSSKVADPNGGGLSTNAGALSGAYDFNAHLRAYAGLIYADTSTTDGFFDRDNGTVTEIPLGTQYFGAFNRFLWVAQADVGVTLYHVDEGSDAAAIAEGVNRARGGAWLIYRNGITQPFIYWGGEYRDGGRSALIPYATGLHARFDAFWAQATVQGFLALGNDSDSGLVDRARRETYLRRVNGGSFRYYAVNPSSHEFEVQAGYRVNQFNVYVTGSYQIAGTSFAQGWGLGTGVRFTLPTSRSRGGAGPLRARPDEMNFAPKQEDYDETLFKEPAAVRSAPPPEDDAPSSPAPKVRLIKKKKSRKTNRSVEKQQENLNKLLNETEKDLEHQ